MRYQSVAGVSARVYGAVDGTGCAVSADDDLSPETTRLIERGAPDDMTLTLRFSAEPVGHHRDEPNDGVVRVESAKWGRFRGCLITDHYGEVDQGRYPQTVDPDTGFDVLTFYDRLVADLAARD